MFSYRFIPSFMATTIILSAGAEAMAQHLAVVGNATAIPSGFIAPEIINGTLFPLADLGSASQAAFDIVNLSDSALLNITTVTLSGPNSGEFVLDVAPVGSIQPWNRATLAINFFPTSVGNNKQATVNITSNDLNHPAFTFAIGATAVDAVLGKSDLSANLGTTEPVLTLNQKTDLFSLKWKLEIRNNEVAPSGKGTAFIYGTNYPGFVDLSDSANSVLLGSVPFKSVKGSQPGRPGSRKITAKLKKLPGDSNQFSQLVVIVLGANEFEDPYYNNSLAVDYKTMK